MHEVEDERLYPCVVCGTTIDDRPMIYRTAPFCSDNCAKAGGYKS